jgi:Icc-related predicted phosphoesterase
MIKRFIGDVHGLFDAYIALTEGLESSIQCGDMGLGFGEELPQLNYNHRFIRGNHDSPEECKKYPNWIKDGTFFEDENIFCVGGAWSIDWEFRQNFERATGNKIWWKDEELSVPEFQDIIDNYEKIKPKIVVSHDCPTNAAMKLDSSHKWDKSKTRQAFDVMFEIHEPVFWIFGHHHINAVNLVGKTRFIALAELAWIDIDVSKC